ncbi:MULTISPECIES: hypothetical protein [Caldilinea]|jgi:hypothetical protein|uniref:Uncharacterized protein n=1 Tax=Caldilinea aerophila (strain DSM 14535 / JCM 11387 / NBRC 104270 / STL-6-O1) TaxID=926550 RepID=I0I9I2_CALAS|nr:MULTISPECIES: hypothetical protein [Caldilinea]MBO9369285.1 hypothetical protein [Chloroflexota bacterium]BAM01920.1 hypothetical protein CLDAP_38800 [Caldilinea aerophila DSM 14535 = NBRC 104270]GIV75123.1 MAG: hypothetical protein KatS3mg049_3679 [Caldilinea sp.]
MRSIAFPQALKAVNSGVLTEMPLLTAVDAQVYLEHKSLESGKSSEEVWARGAFNTVDLTKIFWEWLIRLILR